MATADLCFPVYTRKIKVNQSEKKNNQINVFIFSHGHCYMYLGLPCMKTLFVRFLYQYNA